jgi:hypothetical protein
VLFIQKHHLIIEANLKILKTVNQSK